MMGNDELGFATPDFERAERCGRAEVIFCSGKTPGEAGKIAERLFAAGGSLLATRADREHFAAIAEVVPGAVYHERARCITAGEAALPLPVSMPIGIVTAGTSDLAVAGEAEVTLRAYGHDVRKFHDLGVAGLHRLLSKVDAIRECAVVIVIAGMEGTLASVVAGLVLMPVIAVPTSVGYGANFGGLAALLGMLTSCGSRVSVVNIDNGYGAACAADAIVRVATRYGG